MDKLTMAHEYFMKHVNTDQYRHLDDEDLILWSFDYVDAMQAEAEKREDKTRPEVLGEWQPDWSQAPAWATHFFCERDDDDRLNGYFAEDQRGISIDSDISGFDGYGRVCSCETFNYQGNWHDSLRERPHGF